MFDVDSSVITELDHGVINAIQPTVGAGLTIREASKYYRIAIPTVRLKVKTGDIPAIKVNGPKGPEWRVFPQGLPAVTQQGDTSLPSEHANGDKKLTAAFENADRTVIQGFEQANMNVAALIKANQDLIAKLEALTFRNGYLEAQNESYQEQVKLLTDSQHRRSRLSRFWSWFTGQK